MEVLYGEKNWKQQWQRQTLAGKEMNGGKLSKDEESGLVYLPFQVDGGLENR